MMRRSSIALLLVLFPAAVQARNPGGAFRVTSETSSDQVQPAVSMDRDGRFAVLWGSYSGLDRLGGTFLRLFSAGGSPVTGDLRIGSAAGDEQGPFSVSLDGAGVSAVCIYRDGRVLCDTAHDGGAAEIAIRFGQSGTAAPRRP